MNDVQLIEVNFNYEYVFFTRRWFLLFTRIGHHFVYNKQNIIL